MTETTGFLIIGLWLGGIPIAAFCEVVWQKVMARRERRIFSSLDVTPLFIFWPVFLLWMIVRLPLSKLTSIAVEATDSIADKLERQEESPETLLRASRNPE